MSVRVSTITATLSGPKPSYLRFSKFNSVLTDDLGIKKTIDNKEYFEITGRAKNSEIRGCGDILSETM